VIADIAGIARNRKTKISPRISRI